MKSGVCPPMKSGVGPHEIPHGRHPAGHVAFGRRHDREGPVRNHGRDAAGASASLRPPGVRLREMTGLDIAYPAAFVVGAALAVSGATLQSVLRNPLAEPYLLGTVGGAALFALLMSRRNGEGWDI